MLVARQRGQSMKTFCIVDLRSFDYSGGHINGSVNIPSNDLIRDVKSPGTDPTVQKLQGVQCVIVHCLISRHRAPQCAKFYKEKLNQLGRQQEVLILEGGYHAWRAKFSGTPLISDEDSMSPEVIQRHLYLGIQLGEQFVAQNAANSTAMNGCPTPSQQQLPAQEAKKDDKIEKTEKEDKPAKVDTIDKADNIEKAAKPEKTEKPEDCIAYCMQQLHVQDELMAGLQAVRQETADVKRGLQRETLERKADVEALWRAIGSGGEQQSHGGS
eukprot:gnl/MRDRNA2_/MRDRNA2_33270_c0_seq1.p1 gnl/MRDRNA2_/MRDRNA2_33270_c0~~gnl/MRDRNA2_/MRDRNA2_33270_c0_seq1.p1  ORF type:complete len:312 (-),score=79.94 gnl/MRDRNA2_/MRDRNA2_33270_c0_seq1:221-1030(-)